MPEFLGIVALVTFTFIIGVAVGRDSRRQRLERFEEVAHKALAARKAALCGSGWEREALELDAALMAVGFTLEIGEWRYLGSPTWSPRPELKKPGAPR